MTPEGISCTGESVSRLPVWHYPLGASPPVQHDSMEGDIEASSCGDVRGWRERQVKSDTRSLPREWRPGGWREGPAALSLPVSSHIAVKEHPGRGGHLGH